MTIGLFAIVKNEADVIDRMLDSVEGLFDSYTVVDTGSSDDTVEILKDRLPPNSVHERGWKNFSHNLNEALVLARGTADWLLRVDADQTVKYAPNFTAWLSEQSLEDGYNVEMVEGNTFWRLPRLLKGGLRWEFREPTHEYLDTDGRVFRDLTGMQIIHHADGGSRANKFHRDIQLLADGVEQSDPRATFYTAECYRFLGEYGKAMEMYGRRALMENTWEEERWYAQYQMASCAMLDGAPGALDMMVAAYNRRPSRGEPLLAIRKWCEKNTPPIPDDILFVDTAAHL